MRAMRLVLLTILLLALAALAIFAFQARIGDALYARGADQRAGRDATVGRPDGLHLVLC